MSVILEIITFVIVLVVLILVHELGHFIVAKLSGMRVDEFGIGYPPRALTLWKKGDTVYTLNWLPFGGFVRIYGEDGVDEAGEGSSKEKSSRAFSSKPRILQALTLIAGITMNFLLAFIIFTVTQAVGVQQEITSDQSAYATNQSVTLAAIKPGSPADKAGFKVGDRFESAMIKTKILGISYNGIVPQGYTTLIGLDAKGDPITFVMNRDGKEVTIIATPQLNIIPSAPQQPALGFTVTLLGTVKVPLAQAPINGAIITWNATTQTAVALFDFFKNIVLFKADLSQVSGPVGIAGEVGSATAQGFTTLLSFMALISINLALINLIPIPALDGGRLLFVIIEAIIRRPLNPRIAERVNMVGFALLILLMVVVTGHDIYKLVVH